MKKIIALILCVIMLCALSTTAFADVFHTVHFNADGGIPEPADQSVADNDTVDKPANPQKTDYEFVGWFTTPGNELWKFKSESDAIPVTDNLTLVAHWTPRTDIPYELKASTSSNGTIVFQDVVTYKTIGKALPGSTVRVEVNSEEGYTIKSVYVTSGGVTLSLQPGATDTNKVYTFEMPAGPVTVAADYNDPIIVNSIKLNSSEMNLAKGDSTTLTAETDPADATVTWKFPNFVNVTEGADGKTITIVPNEEGEGYITATAGDKTAQCHIKVSAIQGIIFTLPTSKITDKTPFTITATVTPSSCTEPVEWFVSPSDILSITKDPANSKIATVTPLKNGSCEITAICDGKKCVRTIDVAFTSDYAVVFNRNGSWYYDAPTDYTIQTRRPYEKGGIKSIVITNKHDGLQYTAIEGKDFISAKAKNSNDTVISFYKDFMKVLPHYKNQLITVTYKDGTTSKTGLHILSVKDRPITGDTDYSPYIILAAVSAAGLGAVLTLKKKQKV